MVTMNRLLPASAVYIAEKIDAYFRDVVAGAAVRQRQTSQYAHCQWLGLACNPDLAFDLSFNQPYPCNEVLLHTAIEGW